MNFINCLLDVTDAYLVTDADVTLACLLAGITPEELSDIGSD